jgi:hypothetical protein
MANNFEFLKEIDKELFSNIEDAQKLFRDEYFNQCAVQVRVFAEKVAKKILGEMSINLTFDDTINCLKDKIKSTREQEFVDDLFFIKKIGNKCAHGEDTSSSEALEIIHRAYDPRPRGQRLEYTGLNFQGDTATLSIGDSKEGWAQAIAHYFDILTNLQYTKIHKIVVEYDSIRPRGERLKVFGGTASGYESMMTMLDKINKVITSAGNYNSAFYCIKFLERNLFCYIKFIKSLYHFLSADFLRYACKINIAGLYNCFMHIGNAHSFGFSVTSAVIS